MVISLAQIVVFLLILARIGGLFVTAPLFSMKTLPSWIKVAICMWIAGALWYVVPLSYPLPITLFPFMVSLIIEVLIGALIGFVCDLIFSAIRAAGDIMDLQMGLSVATIMSPVTGGMTSVIGELALVIGMLAFIAFDGHHMVLSAVHQSFRVLPLGMPVNFANGRLAVELITLVGKIWLVGVQLAAPVVLMIFLSDFAFGIVSRVAPQVNVFMLGFQVKPSLGLVAILFSLPLFVRHAANLIGTMGEEILNVFAILK